MEALTHAYKMERQFLMKLLFVLGATALGYRQDDGFVQNVDDNVYSWYILDVTRILQNAENNIVVSPSNIKALLKTPPSMNLRFGVDEMMLGQNVIFAESKMILNNPETLEWFYDCKIQETSFTEKNKLITSINGWIKSITDQNILKSSETIFKESNLQVLILNMLNFKETLQINFKYTLKLTFHERPDSKIVLPGVETTEYLKYLDSQILDAKILELPYSNGYFMYIILPHTKQGVNETINNLGYEQLKRIEWMMVERRVNVVMPTFKYHFITNMREHIQKNSSHRFDVDFEPAFGVETEKINILQTTVVQFNGSGKARVEDYQKNRTTKYERFHVDRPFAFYIEEKSTGRIVSIGKVLNPIQ
uniref:Heparin cofactor 2 n=1 Tax=Bactrocera latifrons TaxID=174628 RepID=A0A0K8W2G0_BACLA